jgi:hypothetical protein
MRVVPARRRRTGVRLAGVTFGLWGGVGRVSKGGGQGSVWAGASQGRRTRVSALRDLQDYFAVVFAGFEEFVGFLGFRQGEDVADLGN